MVRGTLDVTVPEGSEADLLLPEAQSRGAWTCPSSGIYPHQWLWDSCFVAIGLAATRPARAAGELRALLCAASGPTAWCRT